MSIQVAVLLAEDRLLDRDSWQEAIDRLRLPVRLPDRFDPRTDHGYQPFTYRGEPAEGAMDIATASEPEDWRDVREGLGRRRSRILRDRSCCIVFAWSTQTEAAACAMAACAALAAVVGGVVWDLEADEVLEPVDALAAARHTVGRVDEEIERTQPLRARHVRCSSPSTCYRCSRVRVSPWSCGAVGRWSSARWDGWPEPCPSKSGSGP